MSTIIIITAVFFGVATLVGGVALLLRGSTATEVEDRLDVLTGTGQSQKKASKSEASLLAHPLDDTPSILELVFSRFGNIKSYVEQSGLPLTPTKLLLITLACAGVGALVAPVTGLPLALLPAFAAVTGMLPFLVVFFARKRRLGAFARQLPDALELISRALRAGHSLAAGMSLVAEEMPEPIGAEFARCYEEQNLGIPLEEAMEDMTERVPNLDLRFFVTAVVLQRQTGGDLAEILDKIGHLIRERFKIWGQIQALTGEGRLSGIVLLALPPVLFVVMYRLNPDYCMILFNDPMGQKMLALAVVMQIIGALVIRKIINIKV